MKSPNFTLLTLLIFAFIFSISVACNNATESADDMHSHTHTEEEHSHEHAHDNGHSHTENKSDHGHTHESLYSYLRMDGEFKMDPEDKMTRNDPRNPSRISLSTSEMAGTMTKMVFYDHNDPEKMLADCGYVYVGSKPDPHYYPDESKSSIWDIFRKKKNYKGNCEKFSVVISRSPHGDPVHMHLRYGENVDSLLAMSTMEKDTANFNPWWSLYCDISRNTTCE